MINARLSDNNYILLFDNETFISQYNNIQTIELIQNLQKILSNKLINDEKNLNEIIEKINKDIYSLIDTKKCLEKQLEDITLLKSKLKTNNE